MKFSLQNCPQGLLTNAQLHTIKGGNDQNTDQDTTIIQDVIIG